MSWKSILLGMARALSTLLTYFTYLHQKEQMVLWIQQLQTTNKDGNGMEWNEILSICWSAVMNERFYK
jgi:hypothetical protein